MVRGKPQGFLLSLPYAPLIVRILPVVLVRNLGDTESEYAYLTTLRDHTTDPKEIEAIDEELEKLNRKISPRQIH